MHDPMRGPFYFEPGLFFRGSASFEKAHLEASDQDPQLLAKGQAFFSGALQATETNNALSQAAKLRTVIRSLKRLSAIVFAAIQESKNSGPGRRDCFLTRNATTGDLDAHLRQTMLKYKYFHFLGGK
ncbi:hypothetical protein J7426_20725 [Tropicibacter sp. R16_0]|uniref:hypothetical protein n=1 Tax=Tropicibacter sp. R16_0 TaxID=2821102 RepID=UPI001ADC9A93|nr:hypothetical protein [Tropicibacter sp. R16_0]MBO9452706.1 hypothetical protein [Tropicibacter sp. R16_0]